MRWLALTLALAALPATLGADLAPPQGTTDDWRMPCARALQQTLGPSDNPSLKDMIGPDMVFTGAGVDCLDAPCTDKIEVRADHVADTTRWACKAPTPAHPGDVFFVATCERRGPHRRARAMVLARGASACARKLTAVQQTVDRSCMN